MRILMIIERYHPVWGGGENQLKQLIPHLKQAQCTVSVLTRRWYGDTPKESVVQNTTIIRKGIPGNSILSTMSFVLGIIIYVVNNRKSIDMIHAHGAVKLGALASVLSRIIHKQCLAKIATAGHIPRLSKGMAGRFIIYHFKKCNGVIALSNEIMEELKKINFPDRNICRISNAVNTEKFQPTPDPTREQWMKEKGWDLKSSIVLFCGRLVPRKGIDSLIDAWGAVSQEYPNARLVVLGSGKDQPDSIEDQIHKRVHDLKLSNINFEKDTQSPETYFGISNIFVFPSRQEGLSNALLEAMASSLGVVASKIGGNVDLIENQINGILCCCDNSLELSQCILGLLKDPSQCHTLGNRAREDVLKQYTFEKIAKQYVHTYGNLLEAKSG